eukprot:m.123180 g.123180  ORF g.123180 m.123180 type:complete len:551 (+) comp12943_c0_seq11:40-1692(+)
MTDEVADVVATLKQGGVKGRDVAKKRKLVVVMVGLPARGKSYLSVKLAYYLNWIMMPTQIFNLGKYRRKLLGPNSPAQFFSPDNIEGFNQRKDLCKKAMMDIVKYFEEKNGAVAILDATNTTRARRFYIRDFLGQYGIKTMYVESVCENDEQIRNNILQVKVNIPDYKESTVADAVADFRERIEFYRLSYEQMSVDTDGQLSFIKMVDVGRYFVMNTISDYLQMRISRFLLSLHLEPRAIYISRHGESMCNTEGKIGGDSPLSPNGRLYAKKLHEFMEEENLPDLRVWTSSLMRTIETAQYFDEIESWKALDELDAGLCDELTYSQVENDFPEVYEQRKRDKYFTRYPRGESYADVVQRLEPRILDLERNQNSVLVICHQAVARCLLCYFQTKSNLANELPYMPVDLHTVYKITPIPYGNLIEVFPLGVDAVNTYVPREMTSSEASSPLLQRQEKLGIRRSKVIQMSSNDSEHLLHEVSNDSDATMDDLERQRSARVSASSSSGNLTPTPSALRNISTASSNEAKKVAVDNNTSSNNDGDDDDDGMSSVA